MGAGLYVVTSKPTVYAQKILQHYGLAPYLKTIRGVSFQKDEETKQSLLQSVLEEHGIRELSACVMIGDRCYDMEAAKQVGTAAMGALYGFGTAQELEQAWAGHAGARAAGHFTNQSKRLKRSVQSHAGNPNARNCPGSQANVHGQ